jgi:hypothetical protein
MDYFNHMSQFKKDTQGQRYGFITILAQCLLYSLAENVKHIELNFCCVCSIEFGSAPHVQ